LFLASANNAGAAVQAVGTEIESTLGDQAQRTNRKPTSRRTNAFLVQSTFLFITSRAKGNSIMSTSTRSTVPRPDAKPDARKTEWAQAAESAGAMASHAGSAVGGMVSDAGSDVGRRADNLASSAGTGIKEMGDRLSRSGPHGGMLGSATQAVGQSVHYGGEYLETAKLSGMGRDFAQIVRQNPLPAVGIAFGLGWLLASRMRN